MTCQTPICKQIPGIFRLRAKGKRQGGNRLMKMAAGQRSTPRGTADHPAGRTSPAGGPALKRPARRRGRSVPLVFPGERVPTTLNIDSHYVPRGPICRQIRLFREHFRRAPARPSDRRAAAKFGLQRHHPTTSAASGIAMPCDRIGISGGISTCASLRKRGAQHLR